jgi:hypothetical protein
MRHHPTSAISIIPFLATVAFFSGCATAPADRSKQPEAAPVSEVPPQFGEFKTRAEPMHRLSPVPSEGGCEPRYKSGHTGTCINRKPCHGFGFKEESGKVVCICYIKLGGCDAGYRCDARLGQCVKDDEEPFNRNR